MSRAKADDATINTIRQSLTSFSHASAETLVKIEAAVADASTVFQKEVNSRRIHRERCERRQERAMRDLQDCLDEDDDDDGGPDCTPYEEEFQRAMAAHDAAKVNLARAEELQRGIEAAIHDYRPYKLRMKRLITEGSGKAGSYLLLKIANVMEYGHHQVHASPSGGEVAAPEESPAGPAGSTAPEKPGEQGIIQVTVSDLPDVQDINGPEDFRKVSMEQMQDGFRKLQKMAPLIKSGEGANADFWTAKDQELGLSYQDGYLQVYEAFYGSEPIRLVKKSGQFSISVGRHRVWVAQQMGIKNLPASVVIHN